MTIWAIADLHASRIDAETGRPFKPMDRFGPAWEGHMERLEESWDRLVQRQDTVIVVGDIDWGLHLEDAMDTLRRIGRWKGHKLLIRGNHDYWWSSKTTSKVRRALPDSLSLLHNEAVRAEGFNICGAKGSPVPGGIDWTAENSKLLNRETQRLILSLDDRDSSLPTIAALHFPPFYPSHDDSPYREILEQVKVAACVYGHLHGSAAAAGPQGCYGGVEYVLVAGDAVGFQPVMIARDGYLVLPALAGNTSAKEIDMTEEKLPLDDLRDLAEEEMADKREELGSEEQARELYDVPSRTAEELADSQDDRTT